MGDRVLAAHPKAEYSVCMSRKNMTTGIAVAIALAVVGYFLIFNSLFQPADAPVPEIVQQNLIVQDEKIGTGVTAKAGDRISVHYTGRLQSGVLFDSSVGQDPYEFVLGAGAVIPGWDQGLQGMKVGGKRLLIVPPNLAYGAQPNGPIPANATLIFEVELVGIGATSAN